MRGNGVQRHLLPNGYLQIFPRLVKGYMEMTARIAGVCCQSAGFDRQSVGAVVKVCSGDSPNPAGTTIEVGTQK